MQAALSASEAGATVTLVDENRFAGGQIWRKGLRPPPKRFSALNARLKTAGVETLFGQVVTDIAPEGVWLDGVESGASHRSFDKMILAPGGRELFLPFPGWTLPNVMGVGGLQAMVKSGLDVRDKKVVISGSGPLLLAVAAYLKKSGANLVCLAEQAPMAGLFGFARRLPIGKLWEGLELELGLLGVPQHTSAWVTRADGSNKLERVTLAVGSREKTLRCDYLATGYGLVPNTELFLQLSVKLEDRFVSVDEHQQTSVPGVYAVGEATGIGGVDKAVLEGQIAGLHAAGKEVPSAMVAARSKHTALVRAMDQAFRPRAELKTLCQDDTIVCRCEDVTYGALKSCHDQRSAKLYTRCGMGACQGRICASINRELFQWDSNRIRPPMVPIPMGHIYRDEAQL